MNRMLIPLAGAALAVAAVPAARAGTYNPALDYTISINDGNTFDVTSTPTEFLINVPDTGGAIVGFSFEGTVFADQTTFPAVPGQLQLTIDTPDSSSYVIGGTPPSGASWDFQAATATNNVIYTHGPDLAMPDSTLGSWTFTFTRVGGFPATLEWSDVTITLHSIPAPGGLALIGLAAVGQRRRRR